VKPPPRISVIIVNYNGRDLLLACLKSVAGQLFQDIEIIVVDNASTDGSAEEVKIRFPHVKIISLSENEGFAGGVLEGLRNARGNHVLLLNNDVVVEKECIQNLHDVMKANPDVGICASKMLEHGKKIIDSAGDGFSKGLRGFKRGEGLPAGSYNSEEYVFGACAGAALYRKEMLEDIGCLDRDFFLIYEDTDLNLRAQLGGWKARYVPSAVIHHRVRSSIGDMSDRAVFYSLRNCELARIKNIPSGVLLRCLPSLLFGALLEFLYFAVRHGKPGLYLKAKIGAIRLLPRMLQKRREIMKTRKVDNRYLYGIMTPISEKEFFTQKLKKFF
jgi:GT2 family glycosyltransferase